MGQKMTPHFGAEQFGPLSMVIEGRAPQLHACGHCLMWVGFGVA